MSKLTTIMDLWLGTPEPKQEVTDHPFNHTIDKFYRYEKKTYFEMIKAERDELKLNRL